MNTRASVRPALIAAGTVLCLLLTGRSMSSVPDSRPPAPVLDEVLMLEELTSWVRQDFGPDRFRAVREADIVAAIRDSAGGFDLFRGYSDREARLGLLRKLPYGEQISAVSDRYRIDGLLVAAVVEAESGFDPRVISPRGALGLMQLMPGTLLGLGFKQETLQPVPDPIEEILSLDLVQEPLYADGVSVDAEAQAEETDPTTPMLFSEAFEPAVNLDLGARYLSRLLRRFDGDLELALAAYNAGPGNVERFGGVPPFAETRHYVQRVLRRYVAHHQQLWAADPGPLAELL